MFLILLSFLVLAGEPDNFSGRNAPPQNEVVNQYIQKKLDWIAKLHNKRNSDKAKCNREFVDQLIEETFDRNWPDVYALKWEIKTDGPESIDNSVLKGTMKSLLMVPSFRLKLKDKVYSVGIDKLDHFFSSGYLYWKIVGNDPKVPQDKIINALKLGIAQEEGPWGLKSSGLKSYADLSANFLGLAFWRDLWNGAPPFLSCVEGQLVVQKQFQIEEYLNGSVDEAINCSSYASQEKAQTIIKRTEALGRKCPIDLNVCKELNQTIPKEHTEYLLSPLCRGLSSFHQIEKASELTVKDILDGGSALVSGGGNFLKIFFPQSKSSGPEAIAPPSKGAR